MYTRRKFLQDSGLLALGGMSLMHEAGSLLRQPAGRPVGLQLFTLFNVIDQDVAGSLKKVAAIGYREIESAFSHKPGYYGMKPREFASLVADLGLAWKSHHVLGAPLKLPPTAKLPKGPDGKPIRIPPMRNLRDNMQELVDEVAEAGIPYLVCANIPTGTSADIQASIATLNRTGEACRKAGITLAYHNHTEEFATVDGKTPYDQFLTHLSPDIKMELDLCWATEAGIDPADLFARYPGRFPLWHVKDLSKDKSGPVPVGTGIVDFRHIFAHADQAGLQHFFVEHDMPADPYASITTSFQNLQSILKA